MMLLLMLSLNSAHTENSCRLRGLCPRTLSRHTYRAALTTTIPQPHRYRRHSAPHAHTPLRTRPFRQQTRACRAHSPPRTESPHCVFGVQHKAECETNKQTDKRAHIHTHTNAITRLGYHDSFPTCHQNTNTLLPVSSVPRAGT
jgi:hypothetical protein